MTRNALLGLMAVVLSAPSFATTIAITRLKAEPIQLARIEAVSAVPSRTSGTANVSFSVTYSNACVAGSRLLKPQFAVQHGEYDGKVTLVVQNKDRGLRIFCPAVYKPVTYRYDIEVGGLFPGHRYEIGVAGSEEKLSVVAPR